MGMDVDVLDMVVDVDVAVFERSRVRLRCLDDFDDFEEEEGGRGSEKDDGGGDVAFFRLESEFDSKGFGLERGERENAVMSGRTS